MRRAVRVRPTRLLSERGFPRRPPRRPEERGGRGERGRGDRGARGRGDRRSRSEGPAATGLEAPPNSVVWDATIHDPRPLRLGYIRDVDKWAIYRQYKEAPEVWTPHRLAEHHGFTLARIKAIILLKGQEDEIRRRGEVPIGDGLTAKFEEMAEEHLRDMSAHYGIPIRNDPKFGIARDVDEEAIKKYLLLEEYEDATKIQDDAKKRMELLRAAVKQATKGGSVPPEYYDLPKKTKGFAFRDTSNPDAPTRVATAEVAGLRDVTPGEDLRRTWTRNPQFVDTIPLDNPGYCPDRSCGSPLEAALNDGTTNQEDPT